VNVIQAREELVKAAIRCITSDYADPSADSASQAEYADEQLAIAARNLAEATEALPASQRPVGWHTENSLPVVGEGLAP
jgi:hypothetical protein